MMWKLIRLADGPDGTLGLLETPSGATFWILEEEDQGNRSNISRIPAGPYLCKRDRYHKGGYETFEVTGVPNRSRILFHRGNTENDTAGCLLVGTAPGVLTVNDEDTGLGRRKLAVVQSAPAFARFMAALAGVDSFTLHIFDPGTKMAA